MKLSFICTVFLLSLSQCSQKAESDEKIVFLLNSKNMDDVFEGNFLAGKYKWQVAVPLILKDPYNPKISHHIRFKGLSLYQSKMSALKNISGLGPPNKVTYKVDSSVVRFYQDWALKEGLVP